MCSGRVDPAFVLRAFSKGVDGVFMGGCHLNECNYTTQGNYYALSMVHLLKKLMEHVGLNPARLRMELVSAGEGTRFADVMNEFGKTIRELGPLGKGEGLDEEDLRSELETLTGLIPYIKLTMREKLGSRLSSEEDYHELFSAEEVEQFLQNVASYYVDPEKCQACMTCAKRCPVDAIAGGKNLIHVVDQDKCIKCGTCYLACPPRFGAVEKIVGKPVPAPLPEDQRSLVRRRKEKEAA